MRFLLLAMMVLSVGGCSKSPPEVPLVPLSVAEWSTMPRDQKYQTDTFERLKQAEPKYQSEEVWDDFVRSVIVPNRYKDFPYGEKK